MSAVSPGRFAIADFVSPFLLVLLAFLVRAPFFDEPPGRDQGLFMAQAWQWLGGSELYSEIWEHKPGGIVALYGLAIDFGGLRPASIQYLHGLAGAWNALVLFFLARRAGLLAMPATLAGIFYLVFFGGPLFGGFWATAQVEIFVDSLVALALLLLATGPRPLSAGRSLALGLVLGVAVFGLKYSCLPLLGLALLAGVPRTPGSASPRSSFAAILGGFAAVGVLAVLAFTLTGRLADFWQATVEFNWAHRDVPAPAAQEAVVSRLFPFFDELWVLYGLAGWAIVHRAMRGRRGEVRERLVLCGAVLFAAALAQVFFQGKFWVYHYHVVLLPLALLAAFGVQALAETLARSGVHTQRATWGLGLISIGLIGVSYGPTLDAYVRQHRILERWEGQLSDTAWHETYRWGGTDYDYAETVAAAQQVGLSSSPGDRVFVWGFEPSLYWLAQRTPSSRFFYDYPLSRRFGEIAARHEMQLLEDLRSNPPAVVVVVARDANDLESRASDQQLKEHPRLADWIALNFRARWKLGDFTGYERIDREPPSPSTPVFP